ncbi:MAG TPA: hypothetical protein VGQ00_01935 [Candidatus Norongarragalinales archaeon]|nr:hypothetical protein [Candidatus Norongarragalinales archaeon]
MRSNLFILALLSFMIFASASKVTVIDPVSQNIDSAAPATLDLGVVGPGQTVEISAQRASGQLSKRTGYEGKEALWDQLIVNPATLPQGWRKEDGKLYEEPMKAFVIVSPTAGNGDYEFEVKAWDEGDYEGIGGELVFKVHVRVSNDVMDFEVNPDIVYSGTGQPGIYTFNIKNKGAASDVFEISATGLPTIWKYKKNVYVRHNGQSQVTYEIVAEEQGNYNVNFKVTSRSSLLIQKSAPVQLVSRSSVWEDMKAASHGVPLFPTSLQAVYGLVGLISNLIG